MTFGGFEDNYYLDGTPVNMKDLQTFSEKNQIKNKAFQRIGHYCQTVTINKEYNQKVIDRHGICITVALQFLFGKITGANYFPGTEEDITFYDTYVKPGTKQIRVSGWKDSPAAFGAVLAPGANLTYEPLADVSTATLGNHVETAMGTADYVVVIMSTEGGDSTSGSHFLACYKYTDGVRTEYAMFDPNIGEYKTNSLAGVKAFFNTLTNWNKRPKFGTNEFKDSYAAGIPHSTIVKISK
mmetsp:Transcript_22842/g.27962  ORF Transcript_22842/g.27962 Transcript_22842/m.27962 type:complete len:240 (-) Transcript_22842:329-1048(-)|eukprot:CAMPEP_0204844016 /NCGR_PEP_ID=MMETSP1346-20131115/48313_1 /ASSEMBLY_ACC=CAM_ASM_000771 /TAXON_ID=215587 /ORGANISM="Aplanochytrium stocchinoi, Strain GSBS06" /LENGTH=239 /DNA_ID=CAMNT_0051983251 /DNA_START=104 /DNA_END=823 /DNA_ORIENTATION=+